MSQPQTGCLTCLPTGDLDLTSQNTDLEFFNPDLQFVLDCPPGYVCVDGAFPRSIPIPAGTYRLVVPSSPNPLQPTDPSIEVGGQNGSTVQMLSLRLQCPQGALVQQYASNTPPAVVQQIAKAMLSQCAKQLADQQNLTKAPAPIARGNTLYYYSNSKIITSKCPGTSIDEKHYNKTFSPRVSFRDGVLTVTPKLTPTTVHPSLLSAPDNGIYSWIAVAQNGNPAQAIADANRLAQMYADTQVIQARDGGLIKCVYANKPMSYTAECASGQQGSPVTKTIPAGQFTSDIDQNTADQMALDEATKQAKAALSCATLVWNELQKYFFTCPINQQVITTTTPAHTISQAVTGTAADIAAAQQSVNTQAWNLAKAAATNQCGNVMTFNLTFNATHTAYGSANGVIVGGGIGTGGGAMGNVIGPNSGSTSFNNDARVDFSGTGTITPTQPVTLKATAKGYVTSQGGADVLIFYTENGGGLHALISKNFSGANTINETGSQLLVVGHVYQIFVLNTGNSRTNIRCQGNQTIPAAGSLTIGITIE